jgi:hypothetical protein
MALDRGNRERVRDIFFAFAQTCYHMVDWLENDPTKPISRRDAKQYVAESDALSFCDDICQGAKHARLQERDVETSVTESMVTDHKLYTSTGETRSQQRAVQKLYLEWQGGSVLALGFADQCIAEWDRLLAQHRLLAP